MRYRALALLSFLGALRHRRRERDLSHYAFPPRKRPLGLAVVVARLLVLAAVGTGVLVAVGAIR